ncbi:substrate-binding periplasmic protein [Paludibacterium paludis]|nr:transporter substrate-binding domain-containing protein [Paludibacterium paludis]
MLFASSAAVAGGTLRIGVADSDGPPIAEFTGQKLSGGLTLDIGTALARAMQMTPEFVIISRRRVEPSIESGKVHIICNANPAWFSNADKLQWSQEIYPQIERLASLKPMPDLRDRAQLAGKRIGTIRGYNYPSLDSLFAQGRAIRQDEAHLELELKAILKSLSDVAVVSELEFAFWAKSRPASAARLKLHPMIVTSMPTMCAAAPDAPFPVDQLNQAIEQLQKSGQLKTLLKNYQWTPKAANPSYQ